MLGDWVALDLFVVYSITVMFKVESYTIGVKGYAIKVNSYAIVLIA